MILYNTVMGVAAGLALILLSALMRKLYLRQSIAPEGWALSFGVVGIILTVLGGLMSTTWPLNVNPPINILFGEPCLLLGLLLVAASLFFWRHSEILLKLTVDNKKAVDGASAYIQKVLMPVSWVVFGLGMILFACTMAIFHFGIVGGAPAQEPISGLLHSHPGVENTFFGILYGLPAIGSLLAPWAFRNLHGLAATISRRCFFAAGVALLIFSALNYYTHIGLLVNLLQHTNYKY
jgi:hypothetical protein